MARRDVVGSVLACAFLLAVTPNIPPAEGERSLDPLGYALLAAAGSSMGVVRRRPHVVVGVVTGVLAGYVARRYPGGPVFVTGWVALFFLSRHAGRRAGLSGAAALCGTLSLATAAAGGHEPLLYLVFAGWPRSGCASPETSTTAWPTPWPPSPFRRGRRPT